MKIGTILKASVGVIVGVIAAGLVMKWAREADIPLIKDAVDGFDS